MLARAFLNNSKSKESYAIRSRIAFLNLTVLMSCYTRMEMTVANGLLRCFD